jgi:L-rhamnose-H+ transport protein
MHANPFLGVFFHWLGGLASASFYIPYRGVKKWSWETYWLVGGCFSWIIAPLALATLLVPDMWDVLRQSPLKNLIWAYVFGQMWGLGGLTFGLTMRYLGIALGMAIALGYCAAFGTLMPPIFSGEIVELVQQQSGQVILLGVAICLAGIAVSGLAGMSKERELTAEQKQATIQEFSFIKGLLVATFSGVMSASFAYGLDAGKPIAELARKSLESHGGADLWQNLPVLVVVLWGGFTTNFIWCVILNWRNRSGHEYLALRKSVVAEVSATEGVVPWDADELSGTIANGAPVKSTPAELAPTTEPVPIFSNYFFSALAGTTWYMQFFFYSMGQTRMGKYEFSSWTLHMASIIIFSTLWGVALREWKGTSKRTHILIGIGLFVLIASTIIVGYGNYLGAIPSAAH